MSLPPSPSPLVAELLQRCGLKVIGETRDGQKLIWAIETPAPIEPPAPSNEKPPKKSKER